MSDMRATSVVCDGCPSTGLAKPLCYIHVMLSDSYIVPECIVRPGTLGGLISLYEGNFIKLASLLGDPWHLSGRFVSRCSKDCDLHIHIEDGSRYTRELRLTYLFDEPAGQVADPDFSVRIYLDARVAEVTDWAAFHKHRALSDLVSRHARELHRRWARNIVLGKWLDYLLDNGHSYAVTRAR
jgi:uncharacterized protein YqiB (DUF1249 family)